ncbi:MAG: DNA/RNA nuclease SfsA, partial [Planctomycetota bacterium]
RAAKRSDFPDARTDRGRKHLEEMAELARRGVRAVQVFLVGRTDCREAGIAAEIDPAYEQAIHSARAAGVEILAYRARLTKSSATLGPRCPFTP